MTYIDQYLKESISILQQLDRKSIENLIDCIIKTRKQSGRVFFIGTGGGAANASHAVNDFRKIANIEAYTPTDNVSELTARVNDDGWDTVYANWLRGSRISPRDMVFVFSVGGGNAKHDISLNIIRALEFAKEEGVTICGVVGRNGGFTARVADACVVIPVVNSESVTSHTEGFQSIIWHLLVSHPKLQSSPMRWESVQ